MHLLVVSATPFEIAPLQEALAKKLIRQSAHHFIKGQLEVSILVSGPGIPLTLLNLMQTVPALQPDLVLNVGIAGSFDRNLELGTVVQVIADRFADLGTEEADGNFSDLFDLELLDPNQTPFFRGELLNQKAGAFDFLPRVNGITVNTVTGTDATANLRQQKYQPQVESMEGAAVALACHRLETPYLQIRAISNYVERRNREQWQVAEALQQLNNVLVQLIDTLI